MLINDFTNINIQLIINIAKSVKRLNIITNHIDKCKRIDEYLYNEFGIILNVSNNLNKSLIKSEIIINIDFPSELINKYKIYDYAIIINISEKCKIISKRFNGININYYKLFIPKKYVLQGFQNEIVYESLIYKEKDYETIVNKITKDKIKIKKLIGNNGIIRENEFIIK